MNLQPTQKAVMMVMNYQELTLLQKNALGRGNMMKRPGKGKASILRNRGMEYKNRKGKIHAAKTVSIYDHRCRYGCNDKLNEEKRSQVFNEFWALGDWNLQTSFLFNAVTATEV